MDKKVMYGAPCREVTPEEMKKFTAKEKVISTMQKVEGFLHSKEKGKNVKRK